MKAKTSFFVALFFILFLQTIAASRVLAGADAGPDQTVREGDTVILDGSNSSPRNSIVVYSWQQTGGSPTVVLEDADTAKASFTAPNVGPEGTSLTFQLTVIYFFNLSIVSDTDSTIVNVRFVNLPPTADAGPDQNVDEQATVTLDGSNSSDPDDGIAAYQWKQVAGPSVSLSDPEAVQPTFLAPNVEPDGVSFTFELTVTDVGGLQSSDTNIVNVIWLNDPPTANAGVDQTVLEKNTVTLDGSNSSDFDDGIASYQWKQVAGRSVTFSDPTSDRPTFEAPSFDDSSDQPLIFELIVTDSGGLQSSDSTTVSVSNFEKDNPGASGGGCFIATAASSSIIKPHVMILHEFRDRYLITNSLGHVFADLYYEYSPPVADFIARNDRLRALVRWSLPPLVAVSWMTLQIGPAPTLALIILMFTSLVYLAGYRRKFRS
jgi:hypothetical protein